MYTNRSKDLEMRKNLLIVHLFKRDAFGFIFRRASSLGSDQISSSDIIWIMVFADHVWITSLIHSFIKDQPTTIQLVANSAHPLGRLAGNRPRFA